MHNLINDHYLEAIGGRVYPKIPEKTRISEVQGLNRVRSTYLMQQVYSNHIRKFPEGQGPDEY